MVIGHSVFEFISGIFRGGDILVELNKALLVLIPKTKAPISISHFRPISLCNVIFKIITKIISNRLKCIIPSLIGAHQASFIHGRSISDNIIIAQEVIHSMRNKKRKVAFMAIKIDLEKAYDHLKWDFILDTILDARFPTSIIYVIMKGLCSNTMNILWNGAITDDFKPFYKVGQGDPLSPYLFILSMERLAHGITKAI